MLHSVRIQITDLAKKYETRANIVAYLSGASVVKTKVSEGLEL